MSNLKVFLPHLVMLIGLAGISSGGILIWTAVIILFLIFPLLEFFLKNVKMDQTEVSSKMADVALITTFPLLFSILIFTLFKYQELAFFSEKIGLILSAGGLLGGFGITSAHELVHRREKLMRAIGVGNLSLVNFAHWGLEHVFGHHKYVATPEDSASARKNESLYFFWFRDYFGGLISSYKIDRKRVSLYWLGTVVISLGISSVFDLEAVLVWWLISTVAVLLLLTVDYVEHYGLERSKNSEGIYIGVKPHHSWDTSSWITNLVLFNLGFHAHHHMPASLHYEDLRGQPQASILPYGYSVMVLMALIPFIYRPFMNRQLATISVNNK